MDREAHLDLGAEKASEKLVESEWGLGEGRGLRGEALVGAAPTHSAGPGSQKASPELEPAGGTVSRRDGARGGRAQEGVQRGLMGSSRETPNLGLGSGRLRVHVITGRGGQAAWHQGWRCSLDEAARGRTG